MGSSWEEAEEDRMRKVNATLSDLIDAFDNCRIGEQYYLNLKTGEILHTSDEFMEEEDLQEIYESLDEERERYLSIPEESSHEGYRDMVAFAESLEDENLQEKLAIALDGPGAFRRFKDVLLRYPEKREAWFEFQNERLKRRVMEWLEENEIELG